MDASVVISVDNKDVREWHDLVRITVRVILASPGLAEH